ncbi:CGNR zinc finger domain-containing protein [Sphingomonas paucimobilis]|uniref:CGNR zinc finger domain-containing protein n=1 Tax=Sphingomonas paucimobilis TaxID=13689 RepID=UPI0031DF7229
MGNDQAIRFGGMETPEGFVFELSGGALPLDFANTLDERPRGGLERLSDYGALIRWSEQSGLLDAQQSAALAAMANTDPDAATKVHAEALSLRELIFATARAAIDACALAASEIERWNRWRRRIDKQRSIVSSSAGLQWRVADITSGLDGILLAIAEAAITLFTDPLAQSRLRLCAADNCDWTFLDRSRRQNRIWCDMSVCGNRAKASRHYRKASQP